MNIDKESDFSIVRKLGFGCGRLVGGSSMKQSAELVEAGLKLGIRHFDVAPSYGLGTAEDVLGLVLAGEKEVKIATKVGIARPSGAQGLSLLRKYLSPVLKSSSVLKSMVLNVLAQRTKMGMFDSESISLSVEDSLGRLKRDSVDYLLLHEPNLLDITENLVEHCDKLVDSGLIGSLGLGFNDNNMSNDFSFGTIIQRNINSLSENTITDDRYQIVHGAMRHSCQKMIGLIEKEDKLIIDSYRNLGWDIHNKEFYGAAALGIALSNKSIDIVLVSFSDVKRMIDTINMAQVFYSTYNEFE